MKKYIFAAVFVLLALVVIFTADNSAESHSEIYPPVTSESSAEAVPPPKTTTTTVPTAVPEATTTTATEAPYANGIVETAEALIGIDFATDGDEPSEGFDNSGFIYYVLRENGYIGVPRKISAQLEWGSTVGLDEIKAGDVLYFSDDPQGEASFGGIYTGNGIMIYSPYPGEKVKTADITGNYWQSRFVTALSL